MECRPGCIGAKFIVIGLILIANEFWLSINWWLLIGALLIIKGIYVVATKGTCPCWKQDDKKQKKK